MFSSDSNDILENETLIDFWLYRGPCRLLLGVDSNLADINVHFFKQIFNFEKSSQKVDTNLTRITVHFWESRRLQKVDSNLADITVHFLKEIFNFEKIIPKSGH